jgi:hypothetical protein
VACEGELGLLTEDGRVKPALRAMARLKQVIDGLPFAALPPRQVDAVCILNSTQDHWATALGAFMLSKQAGFDISFRYEEQALPDADFYLLPCVTGVCGVAKQRWEQLLAKVRAGATLYLSSNNGYMLNFSELTGLTVHNRSRRAGPARVRPPGAGDDGVLELDADFRLEYTAGEGCELLASEEDGNPVLTRSRYGEGTVYFCALPLELVMAQKTGVSHQPERYPYWRFYDAVSAQARARRVLSIAQPAVGVTEHVLDAQTRLAVLVNHAPLACDVAPALAAGWELGARLYGAQQREGDDATLTLGANDGAIVYLRRAAGR